MKQNDLLNPFDAFAGVTDPESWLQNNERLARNLKASIKHIQDVAYGENPLQKLDIYQPKVKANHVTSFPVLVDIHGGGWKRGSKDRRAITAQPIIDHGIVYVPIDYRLLPACSIDDCRADVYQAISWIYHKISTYNGNPEKIYVMGNSAGGHLAATTAMPGWHSGYKVPEDVIKGVIAISGVFDLAKYVTALKESIWDLQLTPEESKRNSPYYHLPMRPLPSILAYGAKEALGYENESLTYAKALQSVGCNVSVIKVPGLHHFDMMNELENSEGMLFKSLLSMISA